MKLFLSILLFAELLTGCSTNQKKAENKPGDNSNPQVNPVTTAPDSVQVTNAPVKMEVIRQLADDFSGDSALLDLGNNQFMVVHQSEVIPEKPSEEDAITCPTVDKSKQCHSNIFEGCIRGNMKTTMLPGNPAREETIAQLLRRIPSDERMKEMGLSGMESAERTDAEKQNVSIKKAWLHYIYREPDNDFHLIIGDSPDISKGPLLNVEIAGIPRGATDEVINKFMKVRNQVIKDSRMGDLKCGNVKGPLNPPIPITRLVGSLYYDNPHDAGTVGRGEYKAGSAWEIHPVKEIVFGGL